MNLMVIKDETFDLDTIEGRYELRVAIAECFGYAGFYRLQIFPNDPSYYSLSADLNGEQTDVPNWVEDDRAANQLVLEETCIQHDFVTLSGGRQFVSRFGDNGIAAHADRYSVARSAAWYMNYLRLEKEKEDESED